MNWLSQNWVWVILAIGAILFFSGAMRGHGQGHGGGLAGLPMGSGHAGHMGEAQRNDETVESRAGNAPQAAIDPVDGGAVRTASALTSVYQGRIYYFSSKENRDRFEAAPQEYAHNATGYPIEAPRAGDYSPRRRGGC
jgi:YHS domain-containing protein